MSFESTYQLIAPIADTADALCYKAIQKLTGEEVWIHIVRTTGSDIFESAKKVHSGPGFAEKPVLEIVQEGAKAYIVTRPLPPGASLRDWLASLAQVKTPDPMQMTGAFRLDQFVRDAADMATIQMPAFAPPPLPPPPPAAPPPPPPAAAGPPAGTQPGEFTRMFQTPGAMPPAPPPVTSPVTPASSQEPGEFTRMFQSPLAQATPAPVNPITNPVAPPASQQEGEFTRMFRSVEPSPVLPSAGVVPPPLPPPAANTSGPGDFTRLLQTPGVAPSVMPPAPAPPPLSGPVFTPPSINGPSFTAPSLSTAGISAPSFQPPSISVPDFNPPSAGGIALPPESVPGSMNLGSGPVSSGMLSSSDGATQFFRAPSAGPAGMAGAVTPPAAGPGEFTRMMQAPPPASAPAVGVPLVQAKDPAAPPPPVFSQPSVPAATPAAAPAAQGRKINPWLILGNVLIVVMIIILVVVIMKSSR
jgi:hypothetical protein